MRKVTYSAHRTLHGFNALQLSRSQELRNVCVWLSLRVCVWLSIRVWVWDRVSVCVCVDLLCMGTPMMCLGGLLITHVCELCVIVCMDRAACGV